MKEKQITSDQIEIVKQQQAKTEEKFVKRFRPHPGHIMFELNKETGEIAPAVFESLPISYEKAIKNDLSNNKKIVMNPNCIYVSALNIKNALKKLGLKNIKINKK